MANESILADFIKRAHELRSDMFRGEALFFEHLMRGEASDFWKARYKSFGELLKLEDVTRPERFETYKMAAQKMGPKLAHKIGVDGLIAAANVQDVERREKLVASLTEFAEEKQHPPSRDEVKRQRAIIDPPPPRDTRMLQNASRRETLEVENEKLRREVKALRVENDRLRKENERLRAKVAEVVAAE